MNVYVPGPVIVAVVAAWFAFAKETPAGPA
jgi:hypothetical protein